MSRGQREKSSLIPFLLLLFSEFAEPASALIYSIGKKEASIKLTALIEREGNGYVALCIWILSLVLTPPLALGFAELQRFRLIPDESQIVTKVKDPFGNIVNGSLRVRQGEARGDLDRLQEGGSVSLVIDTASYNSNIGLRDQDVHEYYLEVAQYPVIRFDSTGIQKIERPPSPKDLWQITVRGHLELHGVQREVLVPVRLLYETNKIIAQGNLRLVLEDFNIKVPTLLFLKAGSQVDVDFRIVGERQP